jgi:hypothetical protein
MNKIYKIKSIKHKKVYNKMSFKNKMNESYNESTLTEEINHRYMNYNKSMKKLNSNNSLDCKINVLKSSNNLTEKK